MIEAFQTAGSGVQASGTQMQTTANNIANVNSSEFKKSRVVLSEQDPQGVSASVQQVDSSGAYVAEISEEGSTFSEGSNVELNEEVPNMMMAKNTYSANLKTIETADEMVATLLDTKA